LLVKLTPRNVNLGNGRFAMFNKERDILFWRRALVWPLPMCDPARFYSPTMRDQWPGQRIAAKAVAGDFVTTDVSIELK
jgi:hypothetical protein